LRSQQQSWPARRPGIFANPEELGLQRCPDAGAFGWPQIIWVGAVGADAAAIEIDNVDHQHLRQQRRQAFHISLAFRSARLHHRRIGHGHHQGAGPGQDALHLERRQLAHAQCVGMHFRFTRFA
jgi:hypothetical protein